MVIFLPRIISVVVLVCIIGFLYWFLKQAKKTNVKEKYMSAAGKADDNVNVPDDIDDIDKLNDEEPLLFGEREDETEGDGIPAPAGPVFELIDKDQDDNIGSDEDESGVPVEAESN
jgi:hypothetical protein